MAEAVSRRWSLVSRFLDRITGLTRIFRRRFVKKRIRMGNYLPISAGVLG